MDNKIKIIAKVLDRLRYLEKRDYWIEPFCGYSLESYDNRVNFLNKLLRELCNDLIKQ